MTLQKWRVFRIVGFALSIGLGVDGTAFSQTFNSGSNGSDGALNLITPGTYSFDPDDVALLGRVLDPDRDFIYHFTTITIGPGVILKIRAQKVNGPLYWLAQGAVTIAGTLDISGESGHTTSVLAPARVPAQPGPGGFAGGVGGTPSSNAQPGLGPQGGAAGNCAVGGGTPGNVFLVPLVGGSGGGGQATAGGAGGGAGGGAIFIASTASIAVNGSIQSTGGASDQSVVQNGGGGSGGMIRLAAPSVSGTGGITVAGGRRNPGCGSDGLSGSNGRVRIEAFQQLFSGSISGNVSRSTPFNTFLPASPSTVRVATIGGIAVPANPSGSFIVPDVAINTSAPVTFAIEAKGIPLGTVVKLYVYSEDGADQILNSTPLAGTVQASTATASAVIPTGFSRGLIRASWTQ